MRLKNNNELSGGMVNATLRVNGEKIISPFHTDMNKVNLLVGSNPTSTPIKNQKRSTNGFTFDSQN